MKTQSILIPLNSERSQMAPAMQCCGEDKMMWSDAERYIRRTCTRTHSAAGPHPVTPSDVVEGLLLRMSLDDMAMVAGKPVAAGDAIEVPSG